MLQGSGLPGESLRSMVVSSTEVELVKIVKLEQSLLMQVPKECSLVSCAMFVGDEACRHEPCFKHVAREFDYGDSLSQDRWNRQSQLLTYPRAVGGIIN